jgi:L-fucose isomerase-like protein
MEVANPELTYLRRRVAELQAEKASLVERLATAEEDARGVAQLRRQLASELRLVAGSVEIMRRWLDEPTYSGVDENL